MIIDLPWPAKPLHPNRRPHRMEKARATKKARGEARLVASKYGPLKAEAATMLVTFSPPGNYGYDDDNLMASIKAYRDGIADALGVNDRIFRMKPPRIGEVVKGGNVRFEIEVPNAA